MTPAIIIAAIAIAYIAALLLVAYFAPLGWENATGFHFGPCPGERDEDRASDVDAELDGRRLPAGMINLNHNEGINP